MDKSCMDLKASLDRPSPAFIKDVFDAQFLRHFEGPEPGKLFINGGEEGRYAFAVNVDFFNIEGMNVRGASTSTSIISGACLNLPLNICYKPENMYVAGIVTGPKEPHHNQSLPAAFH